MTRADTMTLRRQRKAFVPSVQSPRMPKPFLQERALSLSLLMILAGIVSVIVGVADFIDVLLDLDGWGFYLALIGALLVLGGVIWYVMTIRMVQKFEELLKLKSKQAFVKQQDEIEYLAWRLPSKYEKLLKEKKKSLRIE